MHPGRNGQLCTERVECAPSNMEHATAPLRVYREGLSHKPGELDTFGWINIIMYREIRFRGPLSIYTTHTLQCLCCGSCSICVRARRQIGGEVFCTRISRRLSRATQKKKTLADLRIDVEDWHRRPASRPAPPAGLPPLPPSPIGALWQKTARAPARLLCRTYSMLHLRGCGVPRTRERESARARASRTSVGRPSYIV